MLFEDYIQLATDVLRELGICRMPTAVGDHRC
jgi:hypothetical protein